MPCEEASALLSCESAAAPEDLPRPHKQAAVPRSVGDKQAHHATPAWAVSLGGSSKYAYYVFALALPITVLVLIAFSCSRQNPINAPQEEGARPCALRSGGPSAPGCTGPRRPGMSLPAPARAAQEITYERLPLPQPAMDDSEALSCAEYAVVYRPLDMNGEALSTETNVADCQARCARTDSCAHYAYYLPSGYCHLQDAFASATYNNLEWISGPSGCSVSEQSPQIMTILMYKDICFEVETGYYQLDMVDVTPSWSRSVLECQRRCRNQPFCAHFTYSSISGTCHLERAAAAPVRNLGSGNIAGPPSCHVPKEKLLEINLQRAEALCSASGEDCRATRCCRQPREQCYERDDQWADCRANCTQASGGAGAAWSCKQLGPESDGQATATQAPEATTSPSTTQPPIARTRTKVILSPGGACDADDTAVWLREGKASFEEDMNACGATCLGGALCVSNCVAQKRGYTSQCAKCFGDASACTVSHCLMQCMAGAHSYACRDCGKVNCRPAFQKCTGLSAPHKTEP